MGTRAAGWMIAIGTGLSVLGGALLALAVLPQLLGPTLDPSQPMRGLAVAGSTGLLALGALVAFLGLFLYVLIPAFSPGERASKDYGSHRVVVGCTVLAAVGGNLLAALYFVPATLFAASTSAPDELSGQLLSPTSIAVAAASLDVVLLGIVYLRVVRPGAITWDAMGLSFRRLGDSVLPGLLFGLLMFVASSLLEYLLSRLGIHQTQNALFESVRRASLREFALVLAAGAVLAPIAEEVYFRGFVFRAYLNQKGPWQAFLFSSGLFALVHLNLPALLPIFAMGLLLAYLYIRTGSIVPAIIAHGVNNAAAFTLLFLGLA